MTLFVKPPRPPKPPQPPVVVVLDDEAAKAIFDREPVVMSDGAVPILGLRIGWKKAAGVMGAIYVNQVTGNRAHYGIDFRTGKPAFLTWLN